ALLQKRIESYFDHLRSSAKFVAGTPLARDALTGGDRPTRRRLELLLQERVNPIEQRTEVAELLLVDRSGTVVASLSGKKSLPPELAGKLFDTRHAESPEVLAVAGSGPIADSCCWVAVRVRG